jgi:hypothetical protein
MTPSVYVLLHKSGQMAPELHRAYFLKNSKVAFKSFKKFGIDLDVDIYVSCS